MFTDRATSRDTDHLAASCFERHPRIALVLITLTALIAIVVLLELGARLLLADWGPTIGGERTTFSDYDAELGALVEQARQSGFPYLALDEAFETGGAELVFPHDGHWNSRGHGVAATAIERFLLDRGLLTAATP